MRLLELKSSSEWSLAGDFIDGLAAQSLYTKVQPL